MEIKQGKFTEVIKKYELKRKEGELKNNEVVHEINDQKEATRRKILRKENSDYIRENQEYHQGEELNTPLNSFEINRERHRKPPQKPVRFENTHKRYTNYLENNLYITIQNLRKSGEIVSMTSLINNAVFEYIARYYPHKIIVKQ
ncbi:hypothetical protein [Ammoniphilus sp. CFH 90114]|uniref:hypothetical protein n=1 Tax=Ammoniphilus sp. CFH 90114 TaxID=2493665 RepID=UPI00100EB357|nr:hypothetical protein [Ammoniphilus sp. CFH 90114]RXT08852.1 hypothetical protein EIZ39_08610 [Ammoniphilus sp. CFH 90114]